MSDPTKTALDAIRVLLTWDDPRRTLLLDRGEQEDGFAMGAERVDEALEEAASAGWIRGRRQDLGGRVIWSHLFITPQGYRALQEWPPLGREHHQGPWSRGHWGLIARPILERTAAASTHRDRLRLGFSSATTGDYARETHAYLALCEADYLDARPLEHAGLDDLRLTAAGRDALSDESRGPVDEARRRLVNQSKVDAVIYAVEVGLGDRLKALADEHGVEMPGGETVAAKLGNLNDKLGSRLHQVYAKPWIKLVAAVLDLRNEFGHGRGDGYEHADAELVIDMVERLLHHLPPASRRSV